jgi:Domain of unknown function (DUF4234)
MAETPLVSTDGHRQLEGERGQPQLAAIDAGYGELVPAPAGPMAAPQPMVAEPRLGKRRNPFVVWLLSVVTLGIYYLYWYGKINAEIRSHDPRIKVNVGLAVVALFVPFASLVSMYNTAARVQAMEIADDAPSQISPLVSFILLLFFGVGYIVQVQSHLNAHWVRHQLGHQGRAARS